MHYLLTALALGALLILEATAAGELPKKVTGARGILAAPALTRGETPGTYNGDAGLEAPAGAQQPPGHPWLQELMESGQWTAEARRVLAQAVLAEAGPRRSRDWELIPWVLLRRWHELRRNQPHKALLFVEHIKAYSCPVKPSLASKRYWRRAKQRGDAQELRRIRRRRFFQAIDLETDIEQLMLEHGVRDNAALLTSGWKAILITIDQWSRGEIPNPCPQARHWDMRSAPKPTRQRVCRHLKTFNAFYR